MIKNVKKIFKKQAFYGVQYSVMNICPYDIKILLVVSGRKFSTNWHNKMRARNRNKVIYYIHTYIVYIILDWPKSPFSFFCKINDIFFIFTNNFIDLDILSILAIFHMV